MDRRLEREIEEILEKSTGQPNRFRVEEINPNKDIQGKNSLVGRIQKRISIKQLFITGGLLMLSALIVGIISPGMKSGVLFWSGLTLFITAYAFYFTRPSPNSQLRWRGRPVRYDDDYQSRNES
tara:strand:+ start:106 stop:477 length:372 start_codon:yes stop_codon:yes gene_type:complete